MTSSWPSMAVRWACATKGLMDSALGRPLNLAAYGEPDVADLAAAYGVGLAKNHPFVDGNKRTAFVAVELFLALNGYELVASDADCVLTMLAVAAGDIDEAAFAAWIRNNVEAAMNKAFVKESDGDEEEEDLPGAPALPPGSQELHDRARPCGDARRVRATGQGRAARAGQGGGLGRRQRRPFGKRRLHLRQEAAARDRPPHPLPDQAAGKRRGGRSAAQENVGQVFFGAQR